MHEGMAKLHFQRAEVFSKAAFTHYVYFILSTSSPKSEEAVFCRARLRCHLMYTKAGEGM